MKGAVWRGAYDVRLEELPQPELSGPRDAVVRMTRSAICGTDLHPYRGEIADFMVGTVLGHEFTGLVEEAGSEAGVRSGERVLASDLIACGRCRYCARGWHYHCPEASLFGYGTVVGDYVAGGQAEYVRVPNADLVLSAIPASLGDEDALFAGDILTTAHTGAVEAGVLPGDSVVVVGCGPVGLLALMCVRLMGAETTIALDPDPGRRAAAEGLGALALAPGPDAIAEIRDLCGGGADAVLEAVGSEAALLLALEGVRPRGTVVAVGSHTYETMRFPVREAFARELTLRFAVGDPIRSRDEVLDLVAAGRLDPTVLISHRMSLADAPRAYEMFDRRQALKVVLTPIAP
ncbi:MAG TPA: alcohol dehydrogenase catalytic domain-containing protein [Solirubrobacterales bacterium]|nr:alcohol dehydrogenase catalytic domain-containing protein [Solirubrobacterales bacterium]